MNTNEVNQIADILSDKIYKKLIETPPISSALKIATSEGIEKLAETLAIKINSKLEELGAYDLTNAQMEQITNMATEIQKKFEPDIIVKKMD